MVEYDFGQGTAGNAYDADRIDFALGRVYRITSDDATPLVYVEYSYLGDGTIVSVAHPEVLAGLQMTVGTGDGQINVGQTVYNFSGGSPTGAAGVVVGQTDDYWWIQVTTGTWSETGVISLEASGTPANYMSYTASDDSVGLALTYGQPDDADGGFAGLDQFGRVVDQRWTLGGAADASYADGYAVDRYGYTYDRNSNRLTRANQIDDDFSEAYTYDGLNRLTGATRGGQGYQSWTLDALGNWAGSWFDADDDGQVDQGESQGRSTNEANEITEMTGRDAGEPVYDSAGNMIFDGQQHYRYDVWNRLTRAYKDDAADPGQPGDLIAVYQYDGRGFRVSKAVARYDGLDPHIVTGYDRTDFLYNDGAQPPSAVGWQVLEERTVANVGSAYTVATTPNVQYVMDIRYIDAVVCRFRDANGDWGEENSDGLEETLYYTLDANMNVTALVNLAGCVVESYAYAPYGETMIISASPSTGEGWGEGVVIITSAVLNTVTFASYRLNSETNLFDVRHRVLSAKVSWLSRDRAYIDGMSLYGYVGINPTTAVDPTGEWLQIVIGAGIGAAVGAVGGLLSGGGWQGALSGAAGGALSGGLIAAGFPPQVACAFGGALSSVTNSALTSPSQFTNVKGLSTVGVKGIISAGFGYTFGWAAGKFGESPLLSGFQETATEILTSIGSSFAAAAGEKVVDAFVESYDAGKRFLDQRTRELEKHLKETAINAGKCIVGAAKISVHSAAVGVDLRGFGLASGAGPIITSGAHQGGGRSAGSPSTQPQVTPGAPTMHNRLGMPQPPAAAAPPRSARSDHNVQVYRRTPMGAAFIPMVNVVILADKLTSGHSYLSWDEGVWVFLVDRSGKRIQEQFVKMDHSASDADIRSVRERFSRQWQVE